jgi:hypothetical protein
MRLYLTLLLGLLRRVLRSRDEMLMENLVRAPAGDVSGASYQYPYAAGRNVMAAYPRTHGPSQSRAARARRCAWPSRPAPLDSRTERLRLA